jgi:hypothetical protein
MMNVMMVLLLAATTAVPPAVAYDRAAIGRIVGKPLTSVLIVGSAAIARAQGVHDGLKRTSGGWRVACRLGRGTSPARVLQTSCGFSKQAAAELAADESANAAASAGQFTIASTSERHAYQFAQASVKPAEAARLQLLNRLAHEMQMGEINRSQAIEQWNQLRFTFFLP